MIEINTDKGVVRLDSWEEIVSRPGFVEQIDPSTTTLKNIIGRYQFRDGIYCGLSNCRTPHQRGFLVVTSDGRETNIGKDCGKREFGVDFTEMSRKLERDLDEQNAREGLRSFQAQIPDLQARVRALIDGPPPLHQILDTARSLRSDPELPNIVRTTVQRMVETESRTITRERPATESELEAFSATDPSQHNEYVTENIGILDGVEFLFTYTHGLWRRLTTHIPNTLRELKELDVDALGFKELSEWRKEVESIEPEIRQFEYRVPLGRRLVRKKNLLQLVSLVKGTPARRKVRKYCDKVPDA